MSDPKYRDPKFDPPPIRDDEIRGRRVTELNSSNAMWGWVAGAVVLALILVFVFTRGQVSDHTASNVPNAPAATTTGSGTTSPTPAPAKPAPAPAPATTNQGAK